MKKFFFIGTLTLLILGGLRGEISAQQTKYYVVCGRVEGAGGASRAYVTNVTRFTCRYQSNTTVETQFYDFYHAFVKGRSGFNVIRQTLVWSFDTYDKAEIKRRELVADYNRLEPAWLIVNFRALCDD